MGIDGLLALLRPICQKQHISSFKEKTLGIDILPWLYKGCYSDVIQMSDGQLSNKTKYSCLNYLNQMIVMLQQYKIKPIFVFDGKSLNMKKQTIKKRQNLRKQNFIKAENMINQKKSQQARKHIARSIRVQESIIVQAISLLKTKQIQFIVAPYQSDSQLAKLKKIGKIDAVISQDSDLLIYGCNVIYKLDEQGMCEYVDLSKPMDTEIKCTYLRSFYKFDADLKIVAAVIAGCDYVRSIKGIGIKRAIKLVQNQPQVSILLKNLAEDKYYADKIPENYEQNVLKAFNIFKYALVFNPDKVCIQTLNQKTNINQEELLVIGEPYEQYIRLKVYEGLTNPRDFSIRKIQKIQMNSQQPRILPIKLSALKSHQIDEQNSSDTQQYQDNMIDAMIDLDKSSQYTIWPFQQNLLNICITQILDF